MKKTELIECAKRLQFCEDVTYWESEDLDKLRESHRPYVVACSFGTYGMNALLAQSTKEPARFFLVTSRTIALFILN